MSKTVTMDLTNAQLATLAATIGTCTLMCLESKLAPHAALKRKIGALEAAILDLAKLAGASLPENVVAAGGDGWVAAIERIAKVLECKAKEAS